METQQVYMTKVEYQNIPTLVSKKIQTKYLHCSNLLEDCQISAFIGVWRKCFLRQLEGAGGSFVEWLWLSECQHR
jgi:hypothetical protein